MSIGQFFNLFSGQGQEISRVEQNKNVGSRLTFLQGHLTQGAIRHEGSSLAKIHFFFQFVTDFFSQVTVTAIKIVFVWNFWLLIQQIWDKIFFGIDYIATFNDFEKNVVNSFEKLLYILLLKKLNNKVFFNLSLLKSFEIKMVSKL